MITRPPEIVACLKVAQTPPDLFVIFDSHPRPTHPDGAAFLFSSLEDSVHHLSQLFPVNVSLLGSQSDLQWQVELLAHVSGHFFVRSKNDMRMSQVAEQAFLDANCAILNARTQEKESLSKCTILSSENERLKNDLNLAKEQVQGLARERTATFLSREESHYWRNRPFESGGDIRHPLSSSKKNGAGSASGSRSPIRVTMSKWEDDSSNRHQPRRSKGKERAGCFGDEDDFEVALRTQLEYQAEEAELAAQLQYLQGTLQETFDCSICMDRLPIDDVAQLDGCDHSFCRSCIRQYISTKLDERKFPIPCPCCTTEKDGGRVGCV